MPLLDALPKHSVVRIVLESLPIHSIVANVVFYAVLLSVIPLARRVAYAFHMLIPQSDPMCVKQLKCFVCSYLEVLRSLAPCAPPPRPRAPHTRRCARARHPTRRYRHVSLLSSLDANFARELSGVRERVLEASERRLMSAERSYAHILDERRTTRADALAKFNDGSRVAPAPLPRAAAGRRSRGRSHTTLPMGGHVIAEEERSDSSGSEPTPRRRGSGSPRRNSLDSAPSPRGAGMQSQIAAALEIHGRRKSFTTTTTTRRGRRSSLSCIDDVIGHSDGEEDGEVDVEVAAPARRRRRQRAAPRRAATALPMREKAPLLQTGAQGKGYAAVDVADAAEEKSARTSQLSRFKKAGSRVKLGVQMAAKPKVSERDLPRYLHDAHVHASGGYLHRCGTSFEHLWRVACCEVHRCPAAIARALPRLGPCLAVHDAEADEHSAARRHESGIVSSSHLSLLLLWGTHGHHLREGVSRSHVGEEAHAQALERIMGGFRLIMMLTALYFAFFISNLLPRDGASTSPSAVRPAPSPARRVLVAARARHRPTHRPCPSSAATVNLLQA